MLLHEDRAHFSYSQLMTMLSCPYKYRLQYIEGREWDFLPSSVSFGGAIHESIKSFHKDLQYDCVKDESTYSKRFRSRFILDADNENVVFRDDGEFEQLLDKGDGLVTGYTSTFQHLRPLEVEMEFRLPLVNTFTGELLNKDVVGKLDMVTEGNDVFELKTSASSLPETAVGENLQLILYGWAFRIIYGRAPEKLVLVNLVKTKKPKVQVLESVVDSKKEEKLLHLMFQVNEAIEREAFYPNPRTSYGCGSCCYSLSCEYAF